MNEDFVTCQLADKLKEKGFNEPCYGYYHRDGGDDSFEVCGNGDCDFLNSKNKHRIAAPTISQVLKWLREEKKLHTMIDIWKVDVNDTNYKWGYDIVNLTTTKVVACDLQCADTYEQAALAGIEYVLDNLI